MLKIYHEIGKVRPFDLSPGMNKKSHMVRTKNEAIDGVIKVIGNLSEE